MSTAPKYYRVGRIVYRSGARHVRVFIADTAVQAALACRRLNATNGGRLRDWR